MLHGVLVRRETVGFFKAGDKISLRAKSQIVSDCMKVKSIFNHSTGALQLLLHNILDRRHADIPFKVFAKVVRAEMRDLSERLNSDGFVQVLLDVVQAMPDLRRIAADAVPVDQLGQFHHDLFQIGRDLLPAGHSVDLHNILIREIKGGHLIQSPANRRADPKRDTADGPVLHLPGSVVRQVADHHACIQVFLQSLPDSLRIPAFD